MQPELIIRHFLGGKIIVFDSQFYRKKKDKTKFPSSTFCHPKMAGLGSGGMA